MPLRQVFAATPYSHLFLRYFNPSIPSIFPPFSCLPPFPFSRPIRSTKIDLKSSWRVWERCVLPQWAKYAFLVYSELQERICKWLQMSVTSVQ